MALLVRNVNVLCARSGLPERCDIFVSGSKISALGVFPNAKADVVIDGQGLYCAPGFIDVHSESDHYSGFLEHAGQTELLSQGVTTAIIGQDGASLAPWTARGLETLREITGTRAFNVNWRTVEEFFHRLRERQWGVHMGTLVGYATLRRALGFPDDKTLSKPEILRFAKLLEDSLHAGAKGLSAGARSMIIPDRFLPEMRSLAPTLQRGGGVFASSVHAAAGSVPEFLDQLARMKFRKVILTDALADQGKDARYLMDHIGDWGDQWRFEISPFGGSPLPLHLFLPFWAKKGGLPEVARVLGDEWNRKRIKPEMRHFDPAATWILYAAHHPELAGMNFSDYMGLLDTTDASEAVLKLLRESGLRAIIVEEDTNPELTRAAIRHPRSLIGSRGFSIGAYHRRGIREPIHNCSAFPRYLRQAEEAGMGLDQAVAKITKDPARLFDLPEKGEIREGYLADLAIFNSGPREMDIRYVIVEGELAWQDGQATHAAGGKVLKHIMTAHDRTSR